jgi:MFS family permease
MFDATTPLIGNLSKKKSNRIAVSVFFFTAGFTFASWASRIPHIQAKLQLNEAALGSVLLALPIGLLVSLLLAGGLITRFGSKNVLFIAALMYSSILVLLGLAATVWQLAGTLFIFGIASNLYNISVNTQAVGVEKLYGRSIMATFHGLWSLAGFTGATVGSVMVSFSIIPWMHFAMVGLCGLIATCIFTGSTLPEARDYNNQQSFTLPDKHILQLGLIAFGCLVCEGVMFDWSGVYFKKVVLAPSSLNTLGYAGFMGCMAFGRFFADKVVMKLGAKNMLIFSGIVIFTGLLTAVIFPTIVLATAGFMLVGFGVSSVVPIVYSKAGQNKTMNAGRALAAISTIGFAGFLIGPPLIGFVAEATNLRWSFTLIALIGLSTAILAKKIL